MRSTKTPKTPLKGPPFSNHFRRSGRETESESDETPPPLPSPPLPVLRPPTSDGNGTFPSWRRISPSLFSSSVFFSFLHKIKKNPCNKSFLSRQMLLQQMALKAVRMSDVPSLAHVQENADMALSSTRLLAGGDGVRIPFKPKKFGVIGHRGSGMNMLYSGDKRMNAIKENSILSFNAAAKLPLDFIEFDVQVTKDDCPIIFHDNFILTEEEGLISEKRVTELTLKEFLCYGPQRELGNVGKSMFRKAKDGKVVSWKVEDDDSLCTLKEALQRVDLSLGFNIELKFDDNIVYEEDHLKHVLRVILEVVSEYAKERPIIFSSFQPDAAQLVRKLQSVYPVFFLTNGGSEVYTDVRRNSLDEAIKLCLASSLQGIVSEVRAIFRNPEAIPILKEANLSLLTYGQLNNVAEAVYMQHLMGIDAVIVDLVKEITEAVSDFTKPAKEGGEGTMNVVEGGQIAVMTRPKFSQQELSFLLKLIRNLIQH